MCTELLTLNYIDPNTSQHVFSLLGPMLALLTAAGGMVLAAAVCVRHRIVLYFRRASWWRRIATAGFAVGVLATILAGVWWITG